jgi:hypothetical protein
MTSLPLNTNNLNPLYSKIRDIRIKNDSDSEFLSLMDRNKNIYCQFEKIEFLESVFDIFPKGSLIVRDTSDIITYIKSKGIDTIVITYIDNSVHYYSITSTTYLNNAATETDETFVSINFTNHLYKFAEQNSLTNVMNNPKPYIDRVSAQITKAVTEINNLIDFENSDEVTAEVDETENFALYKPLNSIEYRTELPTDNIFQYLSYLSTAAIDRINKLPRFLFWTGFDNKVYFKYFHQNPDDDTTQIAYLNSKNLRFAVYDNDSPSLRIPRGGPIYRKIYVLTSDPADQFISKKYFYVRKTPKIFNTSATNAAEKLMYQFQDEGERYNIEVISSEGILDKVPKGANEMVFKGHWGYYDALNTLDQLAQPTLIGKQFGSESEYLNVDFMGLQSAFPFVDNPEMWKHQYDLTPLHPNLPGTSFAPNTNNLQRILNIRYDVYLSTLGQSNQLKRIREIERQNFVSYVLCCLAEEEDADETFFAAITGYEPDPYPFYKFEPDFSEERYGANDEPLVYRYYWRRLNLQVPSLIPLPGNSNNNPFRGFENNNIWALDANDGTISTDLTTFAFNLNERMNVWYGPQTNSYYAPGWHADSIVLNEFLDVKYRPISQNTGELDTSVISTTNKRHIVKMTKTSIRKLLRNAGETNQDVLDYYANRYLYTFDAQNIVDGKCPPPQQ